MKIRTNKAMEAYLDQLGYDFLERSVDLPDGLKALIGRDFLTENDCIILKGHDGHDATPLFGQALEKCEWEDQATHFHPDFAYSDSPDELDYLTLALECGKRLMHRLGQEFPRHRFRLLISFCPTIRENDQIEVYGSSTVRFYQIRPACEEQMRIADLENFALDAVLEMET